MTDVRFLASCLAVLLLGLGPNMAKASSNTFRWTTNFYTVTGMTLPEVHRSMNEARPWKDKTNSTFAGLTDWRISWRYEVNPSAGGCRCTSFTTQTSITTTLPRWSAPAGASEELKAGWQKFITALGEHEMGHARLALAALADMHRQVKALGDHPDCNAMGKKIDATALRVVEEHRKRDRDYDERTAHGANQGAGLPRR